MSTDPLTEFNVGHEDLVARMFSESVVFLLLLGGKRRLADLTGEWLGALLLLCLLLHGGPLVRVLLSHVSVEVLLLFVALGAMMASMHPVHYVL